MKPIQFEITSVDIKRFLQAHQNDTRYRYRKSFFVKYMKENGVLTQEFTEMYAFKSGITTKGELPQWYDKKSPENPLPNFSDYCDKIELEISGLCHIFLPLLRIFNLDFGFSPIDMYYHLVNVRGEWSNQENKARPNHTEFEIFKSAVDDYQVAGEINTDQWSEKFDVKKDWACWNISKEECKRIIEEYKKIYHPEEVEKIKTFVMKEWKK